MKILLLGSNGQLGSDILRVNAALEKPFEITAWTRGNLDVADFNNIKTTLAAQSFDVLINCTSYHNTDQVESNPTLAFAINAFAVREMAKACQEKNACLVHISTDYVFGGTSLKRPIKETDNPAPLNVYGASKLMGESLASAFCEKLYILRVASLFGVSGASGKGGNFIETILRHAREKGKLRVVSDQQMTPTSTKDIAVMLLKLLSKQAAYGIYNAVNSGQASWYDFALKAVQLTGTNATVEPIPASDYPLPAMRPFYSVLDNSKICNVIGSVPDWCDALQSYLAAKQYIS